MIEISNLNKYYDTVHVLQEVSVTIEPGDIVGVMGKSGCGKTTLLRSIAGLEMIDSGSIYINGVSYELQKPEQRPISLVFQNLVLFPHMTVEQNIAFAMRGKCKGYKKIQTQKLLHVVGLNNLAHRYPHEISGGQQQRIALIRALAREPHLLLLDEPFNSLDPMLKTFLLIEIKNIIKKAGVSTLFVTHDKGEAFTLCDKILVMDEGIVQQYDTLDTLFFRPVNTYTAHLLGKINKIFVEKSSVMHKYFGISGSLLLRPCQFILARDAVAGYIPVVVLEQLFFGSYYELLCQADDGQEIIVYDFYTLFCKEGQRIYLGLKQDMCIYCDVS